MLAFGLVLGAAGALPAQAAPFVDVFTGLRVDAPEPLQVEKINNNNFASAVGIRAPAGSPQPAAPSVFLCQVGFVPRPVDGTQDEINASMLDPSALEGFSSSLAAAFESYESATFTANGVAGFEFFAVPRDATANRLYTTIMQTPAGMVQQHCTTTEGDADAALPLFRAIRDTIVPP